MSARRNLILNICINTETHSAFYVYIHTYLHSSIYPIYLIYSHSVGHFCVLQFVCINVLWFDLLLSVDSLSLSLALFHCLLVGWLVGLFDCLFVCCTISSMYTNLSVRPGFSQKHTTTSHTLYIAQKPKWLYIYVTYNLDPERIRLGKFAINFISLTCPD